MTRLVVREAARPTEIRFETTDRAAIAAAFADLGALYEHWEVAGDLPADADPSVALELYGERIGRLKEVGGYQGADVVRLRPDHPDREKLRTAFLQEHTHADDEVRFFAEGTGVFYLHIDDQLIQIDGEQGDLLLVPKGVKHWFDAGTEPNFTAVRIFTAEPKWEALYTGDAIALAVEAALVA
ncbi:cupin domain-containing protein [Siculibacillus lacustris]|uniref:Acireductone dioxygenase n=1 Tax=Siculibacillus lacustris TaxID=1549641 RepID=A0A4V2KUF0_9HYPH|nr:cupin domain-containing protein [Siculibacillus lacustris]TBW41295.1 cupin domain-containing protein [Siculibacillus lacustris]